MKSILTKSAIVLLSICVLNLNALAAAAPIKLVLNCSSAEPSAALVPF